MVVGNGQLAQTFKGEELIETCIFASGVSNSGCTDIKEFEREKNLLIKTLEENKEKKFVYFSSCALSAVDYPKNDYYRHKENMETIIKQYSSKYYIFRIPQLFGDLILHKTLINFIYKCIEHEHHFNVYSGAYRYVIEINDVKNLVEAYLNFSSSCITVDIANPHRYSVLDIVGILEKLQNKKAKFTILDKQDQYHLEFDKMQNFIEKKNLILNFGEAYLFNKIKSKLV